MKKIEQMKISSKLMNEIIKSYKIANSLRISFANYLTVSAEKN